MKNIFVIFLLVVSFVGCGKENSSKDKDLVRTSRSSSSQGIRVKAISGLNMRRTPSLRAPILRLIPNKSKVELIKASKKEIGIAGKKGHWVLIEFGGLQGWVFDAFLRK